MKKVSTVAARAALCLFYGMGEDCLMHHCGSGGSHVDGRKVKRCSFVAVAEDHPLDITQTYRKRVRACEHVHKKTGTVLN